MHARERLEEAFAGGGGVDLDVVAEVEGSLVVVLVLLLALGLLRVLRRRGNGGGGQHMLLLVVAIATRVERRRQRFQLRRSPADRRLVCFCRPLLQSSLSLCNLLLQYSTVQYKFDQENTPTC